MSDKPFCSDVWFHEQHLVASISFIGGLYGDEQYTFHAPYLPELNEFYARTMHFQYDKLRIEPDRIGVVIDAADHDSFLYALPVAELMERIFDMAGYEAKLSNAGLIAKQLITRLGGVQGGRVFKVPGVRRLLKTYGLMDVLKHSVICDLCGHQHDVTRNLTDVNEWHYRKSGVLGVEKHAKGAVPVSLTLQQLDTDFRGGLSKNMYSPSLDLTPKPDVGGAKCETDFVWVISRVYPRKTVVILAECKDQGPITSDDVSNLKQIVDALPRRRFKTFVILSKISPFTDDEINIAKTLNDQYRRRAILLSANELEPYFIRERIKDKSGRELRWYSPEEMANSTVQLYFLSEEVDVD